MAAVHINSEVRAEAAAWLARLRADNRSVADEKGFRTWLAQDPAHTSAFEEVSTVWETAGALPHDLLTESKSWRATIGRRAVLASLGVSVVVGSTFVFWRVAYAGVYETDVGEQKHISLDDGTQVFLDTDTRIKVDFSETLRSVDLQRGRANFHVAPDAKRPFVVNAAKRKIVATQTTFDVRRDGDQVSVVLIQGHATVVPKSDTGDQSGNLLTAGERMVDSPTLGVRTDRPNLLPLLAWQSGQAIFENETLSQAVDEMNRYSSVKLEIADAAIARLRLSGVYRVGDNAAFARSVSTLLPVVVSQVGDRLEFSADVTRMPQG